MDKFKQVKSEKEEIKASKTNYSTSDIRKLTAPVYNKIVNGVETFAAFGADPAYATFITNLNAVIAAK